MAHQHEHHHHHVEYSSNLHTAFLAGIALNLTYVIIQIVFGLYIQSLSLLSDAGHNFADVASLALSLIAFRLNKVRPTERYTYGYRKTSILTALINSIILLISIGIISFEAFQRLLHPAAVLPGKMIAWVAFGGIIINGVSALFFLSDRDKDLNVRSAYLHLLSDALLSFSIVIGGILM